MTDRFIALEGVRNLRDFGGYAAADGARVRRGLLFRAGHLADATDSAREALRGMGLRLVVDLRRKHERALAPNALDGVDAVTIASEHEDDPEALAPHIAFLSQADLTEDSVAGYMRDAYRRIPYESHHIALYSETFARLAAGEGPVVIHCAAGKDRTGILCALIHAALGVAEADIEADYLLTNAVPAGEADARLRELVQRILDGFGRHAPEAAMRRMMGVETEYLQTAWAVMDEVDGGRDGYLRRLGVDTALRDALRRRLLG